MADETTTTTVIEPETTPDAATATVAPVVDHPAARQAAEAAAAATDEVVAPRPLRQAAEPDAGGFFWGTGRRKASVARVRVKPGTGKFLIKGKPVEEYFSEPQHRAACYAPLEATGTAKTLDIFVNAHGGGITGQSGAVLLGVARALVNMDPATESALREHNYLTRDPRRVERKKYGQPGARRRFQFSKR